MLGKLFRIFKREYQTLNKIDISRDNLLQNFKYLSSLNKQVAIAPVLKSNAYGHGLLEIARILDDRKTPFFCVDSLYEAYELLKANIKTPILIMGYTDPRNFKVKKLPFSYAVLNSEMLEILNIYQPGCGIHIFVDTGMHREGISSKELPSFLDKIRKYPNLRIEGLMSHLTSADDKKDPLNKLQIKNFKKALEICKLKKIDPKWIHMANSDGLLNFHSQLKFTNMARVGLASYGISKNPKLLPVLKFSTQIVQIKKIQKGGRVGYSGTFTVKKDITLGVLPLGYYDGVDRRLSNKGYVTVESIVCPIVGMVSMNITTIDLSQMSNPYIGQEVVIYSDNPANKNSIENAAKICKTISYDILIGLAASTKRGVL